ncbi:MAG: hypothetical protein IT368_09490, partial [Candidatus Hydrogenedentes bacterium]|nr:hypothetical protein [Candidatus Hydrogenedentota bacterium]
MKYARWAAACLAAAACTTPAYAVDFETEVWPILQSRCIECHGADRVKGDLRLDSQDLLLKGGESGPVIVAGKPEESKLYQLIILPADDPDIMPAKGDPLTPEQT